MMPLLLATATLDSITASFHSLLPSGIVTLGDAAARALLVAVVVGAGLRIMATRHVPAQKAAWGLVLAGAILMPILASWAGKADWIPAGATWVVPTHTWGSALLSRTASPEPATPPSPEVRSARALRSLRAAQPVASALLPAQPKGTTQASPSQPAFQIPTVASSQAPELDMSQPAPHHSFYLPASDLDWMIYGAICLALLLRLAYGLGGAIGLWQSAEPASIDPLLADGLRVRSSRKITSPVTVGSGVVLPADYPEWDTEKLRIVLAHERSHVRQGDFYLQALAGLYTAMFWFSPLGWWLKRKLSELSETISDHAGLEHADSHAAYARILLEFAALPRRAQVGVAMARTGGLSQRIERLLNENAFRQAFTGGRRRLMAALLLVPIALFAATTLIRVQAAQTLQQPVSSQGPIIALSNPESTPVAEQPVADDPVPQPQPEQASASDDADGAQEPATAPPAAPTAPAAPKAAPAPAPEPPSDGDVDQDQSDTTTTNSNCNGRSSSMSVSRGRGYSYSYSSDGDSYALIFGKDMHGRFSGDWHNGEIDKARAMAHGSDFLWFSRDGKSYVVDDPQVIAQVQAMYRPMEDLGRQQRELGDKQRALGEQQRALGERQRLASIPTPDVSREMTELNTAIQKLQAQQNGTITMQDLGEIQGKIGQLQGKLGGLQGQIGSRQGELGREQGRLGEKQGELGRQQGELGRQQGRLAREANHKVESIIDDSLKDGRARPVQ